MKHVVYFYKENDYNVAIGFGESNGDLGKILTLTTEEMTSFYTEHPQCENNLFVLMDGMIFKIKHPVIEK